MTAQPMEGLKKLASERQEALQKVIDKIVRSSVSGGSCARSIMGSKWKGTRKRRKRSQAKTAIVPPPRSNLHHDVRGK